MNDDMIELKIHPVAALFPMMSDDELTDLAADIKANGQLLPIVIDGDTLIDGRNRREACKRAGIEPWFEKLNGQDATAFILSANVARRHLNKGQIAITIGRVRGLSDSDKKTQQDMSRVFGVARSAIAEAEIILKHAPELAEQVLAKTETFDAAYAKARQRKAEAQNNEDKMTRLRAEAPDLADLTGMSIDEAIAKLDRRKADQALLDTIRDQSPDLVALVEESRMSVQDALAAHEKRFEEERNTRSGCTQLLSQIVRLIDIVHASPAERAERLMKNFDPHLWPAEELGDLTSKSLGSCTEMLRICTQLRQQQERSK